MALFFRLSAGRKWIVGIRQTSCMGSASTKQEFFRSQPAPSRYRPRTQTPSWREIETELGERPYIDNTFDLTPLSSSPPHFPLFLPFPSTSGPHPPPTLGGYTRLLSSTVETINSQERLSTEICGLKATMKEAPQARKGIHVPRLPPTSACSHCFGEPQTAVPQ